LSSKIKIKIPEIGTEYLGLVSVLSKLFLHDGNVSNEDKLKLLS
jgi:hypothetical protein